MSASGKIICVWTCCWTTVVYEVDNLYHPDIKIDFQNYPLLLGVITNLWGICEQESLGS